MKYSIPTLSEIDIQLGQRFAIEKHIVSLCNRLLSLQVNGVSELHYVNCRPFDFYENHSHPCVDTIRDRATYNKTSSSYACEMVLEKCSKGLRNSYIVLQHAVQIYLLILYTLLCI